MSGKVYDTDLLPIVVGGVGRGGTWFDRDCTGSAYSSSGSSGYGRSLVELVTEHPEIPDGCPLTDILPMSDDDILTFAIAGPMVDASLPAGMVSKLGAGLVPWDADGSNPHDPRLGSARGFDRVAIDVYLTIVRRFGGYVTDAGTVRASIVAGVR